MHRQLASLREKEVLLMQQQLHQQQHQQKMQPAKAGKCDIPGQPSSLVTLVCTIVAHMGWASWDSEAAGWDILGRGQPLPCQPGRFVLHAGLVS